MLPAATVMGWARVREAEGDTYKVASELPELWPKVITFPFPPKVLLLFPALTVPAWMVSPPVKVRTSDGALPSVTPPVLEKVVAPAMELVDPVMATL